MIGESVGARRRRTDGGGPRDQNLKRTFSVQFRPEEHRALLDRARAEDTSAGHIVRRALKRYLAETSP